MPCSRHHFGYTDEAAVLGLADTYAPVIVVMLYASTFKAPMSGLINGSIKSKMNLLIAILDGIVGHIGFAALLDFAFGIDTTQGVMMYRELTAFDSVSECARRDDLRVQCLA